MASTKGTPKRARSRDGTFGSRLRIARKRVGLSVRQAAKKMNVQPSTFYYWEADERTPRDLMRLIRVVDATVAELYGESAA